MFSVVLMLFSYSDHVKGPGFIRLRMIPRVLKQGLTEITFWI